MPGKFHGETSLVGFSSCGHKESGMTELTHTQYKVIINQFFFSKNKQTNSFTHKKYKLCTRCYIFKDHKIKCLPWPSRFQNMRTVVHRRDYAPKMEAMAPLLNPLLSCNKGSSKWLDIVGIFFFLKKPAIWTHMWKLVMFEY